MNIPDPQVTPHFGYSWTWILELQLWESYHSVYIACMSVCMYLCTYVGRYVCMHAMYAMDVYDILFVYCVSAFVYVWKWGILMGSLQKVQASTFIFLVPLQSDPQNKRGPIYWLLAIQNSTSASPKPTASKGNFLQGRAKNIFSILE